MDGVKKLLIFYRAARAQTEGWFDTEIVKVRTNIVNKDGETTAIIVQLPTSYSSQNNRVIVIVVVFVIG